MACVRPITAFLRHIGFKQFQKIRFLTSPMAVVINSVE
jgi:hypothetical protein